eukprot:5708273-Heterocapsa_arctica.AAC.1
MGMNSVRLMTVLDEEPEEDNGKTCRAKAKAKGKVSGKGDEELPAVLVKEIWKPVRKCLQELALSAGGSCR